MSISKEFFLKWECCAYADWRKQIEAEAFDKTSPAFAFDAEILLVGVNK